MKYIYLVFGSETTAIKVYKEITKNLKVESEILQTPKKFKIRSCTYSVLIDSKYKDEVLDLIKKMNVYIVGVFDSDNTKIL